MIRNWVKYARGFLHSPRYLSASNNSQMPPAEREQNKIAGLNLLINRVYITTGTSFLATICSTYLASTFPYLVVNPFVCFGMGGLLSIAGFVSAWYMKPQQITVYEATRTYIKTTNSTARLAMYGLGCMGVGISFLPFANMAAAMSPYFLTNLMALTIGSFGGASLLVTLMPKMKLFREVGLIGAAVGGFIMMSASNYIISSIYGEHFLSNWIQAIDTYAGVILFFFMIVHNTRLAKQEYNQGRADHLGISMRFLYDSLAYIKKMLMRVITPSSKK